MLQVTTSASLTDRPDSLYRLKPVKLPGKVSCIRRVRKRDLQKLVSMSSPSADKPFFTQPAAAGKLIALILNYTLPTQIHKLLQKGV